MKCFHEKDITVTMKEMFVGYHKGLPVYTCMYCGKQYDEKGEVIFDPCKKRQSINAVTVNHA